MEGDANAGKSLELGVGGAGDDALYERLKVAFDGVYGGVAEEQAAFEGVSVKGVDEVDFVHDVVVGFDEVVDLAENGLEILVDIDSNRVIADGANLKSNTFNGVFDGV